MSYGWNAPGAPCLFDMVNACENAILRLLPLERRCGASGLRPGNLPSACASPDPRDPGALAGEPASMLSTIPPPQFIHASPERKACQYGVSCQCRHPVARVEIYRRTKREPPDYHSMPLLSWRDLGVKVWQILATRGTSPRASQLE